MGGCVWLRVWRSSECVRVREGYRPVLAELWRLEACRPLVLLTLRSSALRNPGEAAHEGDSPLWLFWLLPALLSLELLRLPLQLAKSHTTNQFANNDTPPKGIGRFARYPRASRTSRLCPWRRSRKTRAAARRSNILAADSH
jgi:hypothetical protein